jgi:uncharacterized Zn finger protein (UPF0148 family)
MAETTLENAICESCGVDVRDGTQFCYNCGTPVTEVEPIPRPESAESVDAPIEANGTAPVTDRRDEASAELDELSEKVKDDDADEADKLAAAAAERKKARVRPRKKRSITWQPVEDGPGLVFIAGTLLIVVLTAVVVLLTVYWK